MRGAAGTYSDQLIVELIAEIGALPVAATEPRDNLVASVLNLAFFKDIQALKMKQPSQTPSKGANETDPTSTSAKIDPSLLAYIETKLSTHQKVVEARLAEDREFVKYILGVFVKAVGIISAAVVAFGIFFGLREWKDVRDRIDQQVQERLRQRSDTLDADYREKTQGLVDRAVIQSYNLLFSSQRQGEQSSRRIVQSHVVRFATLLSSRATDLDTFSALAAILSNPSRDGNAAEINEAILGLMRTDGAFDWIKADPAKLSILTSLMIDREMFQQPAIVRNHFNDTNLPIELIKNLYLYVGYSLDYGAQTILENRYASSSEEQRWPELMFAILRLTPDSKSVNAYLDAASDFSNPIRPAEINGALTSYGALAKLMQDSFYVDNKLNRERASPDNEVASHFLQVVLNGGQLSFGRNNRDVTGFRGNSHFRFNAGLLGDTYLVSVACQRILTAHGLQGLTKIVQALSTERNIGRTWLTLVGFFPGGPASLTVERNGVERDISGVGDAYLYYDLDRKGVSVTWRNPSGDFETGFVKNGKSLERVNFHLAWN